MATSEDASLPPSTSAGFSDALTHFLLVVVGEPLEEDYIDVILAEVEKGGKADLLKIVVMSDRNFRKCNYLRFKADLAFILDLKSSMH